MSNVQAIVRNSYTVTITFTGVPSVELRKTMQESGFKFRNGQWMKNRNDSQIVAEGNVATSIAA